MNKQYSASLETQYLQILDKREFSDVTLLIEDKPIFAH